MPQSNTILMTDGKQSGDATAGSSTGSNLIPRTLFSQMAMVVRKNLILRAMAARVIGPGSIPGSSVDIPLQSRSSMEVQRVGEGAVSCALLTPRVIPAKPSAAEGDFPEAICLCTSVPNGATVVAITLISRLVDLLTLYGNHQSSDYLGQEIILLLVL